jgi:uncharacterized protein DUF4440
MITKYFRSLNGDQTTPAIGPPESEQCVVIAYNEQSTEITVREIMAEHTLTDELREAERRLQAAQLAGNIAALDQLLDDRVIFTFGPGGKCYTKHDDLQVLTKVTEEDLTVLVEGRTGVTWFLARWRAHSLARHSLHGCGTPAPGFTTTTTAGVSWPPTPAPCDNDSLRRR